MSSLSDDDSDEYDICGGSKTDVVWDPTKILDFTNIPINPIADKIPREKLLINKAKHGNDTLSENLTLSNGCDISGNASSDVNVTTGQIRQKRAGKSSNRSTSEPEEPERKELELSTNTAVLEESQTTRRSARISNRGNASLENVSVPNKNQRGRARRSYITEKASQATVVDCINLVSSPFVPNADVVIEDSDDEKDSGASASIDISLDDSFDLENRILSVKVNWYGKTEFIELRKFQKFSDVLKILAAKYDTHVDDITLNLGERIIQPNDTPDSIGYKIYEFIGGRILKNNTNNIFQNQDPNMIEVKVQSDKWKRPLRMKIRKTEKFKILYIKCCEELNIHYDQIKLSFDGEYLEFNNTPEDLDMDGGEVIDCRIK